MDSGRCRQMTTSCKCAIIVPFCIQVDRRSGGGGVVVAGMEHKKRGVNNSLLLNKFI